MGSHAPPSVHQKHLHQRADLWDHSLTLCYPKIIQSLPLPCILGSMHKLLSTSSFLLPSWSNGNHHPISMLVGVGEQDMLDGWWKTSAMLTKDCMPVALSHDFTPIHVSRCRAGARTQSVCQRTHMLMVTHSGHCVFVWVHALSSSSHSPFFSIFSFQGGSVHGLSFPCDLACWGGTRTTDHTLGGDGSSN